ncbi:helix-turn-helix domain-containing protein [Paucihalobacter sp.]|uniref:helix-turn-helix domain-containing protein n=1 Tax=Paucihalobacter sp. TaxID=2850405 RepID=UPI002FE13B4C
MINTPEFSKRLEKVIQYYGESASSFADNIGVQRSSISHILSGRNKPSLDFVMKVLTSYPEVELYWLLNGKGHFPSDKTEQKIETIKPSALLTEEKVIEKKRASKSEKLIERIVIFYSDGSFENFETNN